LRDARRLATGPAPETAREWAQATYSRLAALPEEAQPLERGRLVAALLLGTEMIRLRRASLRLGVSSDLDPALAAFAEGRSRIAVERLARLDDRLASPRAWPEPSLVVGVRGSILAISEVLTQHAAYFDAGGRA